MIEWKYSLKRVMDLILTIAAAIVLSPLFPFISFLIRLESKGPVFFIQKRAGKKGKAFYLFKFRTMKELRNGHGNLLPDKDRITKFGQFLRKTSLDELPELWNVLKGDMSLVGPRPLLVDYLDRYSPEQARRHEIKPGITGWAQVNGRNAITWEQKFKYDIWYIDNHSLWFDIKIIAMSIIKVIKGEGIHQPGQATMEEFRGSRGYNERQV